jgi:predicted unusual protein kinase regulating ubiquinone biosynthesis (AarF/ABC1/UbiB family)
MFSKLDTRYLARYRDIALLLMRHGGREILRSTGLDAVLKPEDDEHQRRDAAALSADLEALGPTFVKVGQLLAGRADVLPEAYLDALRRLHDKVEPFGFDVVKRIIEQELGRPIEEAYATFSREPLAAASIGQVHAATLNDGTAVVVKVQRPDARKTIDLDLRAMEQIAWLLDEHTELGQRYRFRAILRQFERALHHELDYTNEADNLELIGRNLADFHGLVVPLAYDELTTAKVLTMQRIKGVTLSNFDASPLSEAQAAALADEFLRAYLQQIIQDGVFHADPHPGNLMLTDDGRLALIDLGMVGRVSAGMQESILRLLVALGEGRTTDAAEACEELGDRTEDFDASDYRSNVREAITLDYGQSVGKMQLGRLVLRVTQLASEAGLRVAPEVMLLGKTLVHLDESGKLLAPEFNTHDAMRRHVSALLRQKLVGSVSFGQAMVTALQTKQFMSALPTRISKALDIIADNAFRVKVDMLDEDRLIEVIEKIANRVTIGLVVAAMILAGAFLMGRDAPHMLWGYPTLGLILTVVGLCVGVLVLARVFWNDFFRGS